MASSLTDVGFSQIQADAIRAAMAQALAGAGEEAAANLLAQRTNMEALVQQSLA